MTSILLRRATQIANRISQESAFEVEQDDDDYPYGRRRKKKTVTLNATATVSIDGYPERRIEELRSNLLSRRARMFDLMEIGTRVRQGLARKQADCGVSDLVAERVMVVRQRTILEHLLGSVDETTAFNTSEFSEQVRAVRQRLVSGTGPEAITTVLLTSEDRELFKTRLHAMKRRLRIIDDTLSELNSKFTIEISEDDMRMLEAAGIV